MDEVQGGAAQDNRGKGDANQMPTTAATSNERIASLLVTTRADSGIFE